MLIQPLLLPIALCTVALFFTSFLSWMVLGLHSRDWGKLPDEDPVLEALRKTGAQPGNYMVPGMETPGAKPSEEYLAKMQQGPMGVLTLFPGMTMGRNLALTFLYFFVVCVGLAYLARLALPAGAEFMTVFRFVSTASLMTFLAALVQHAIWFRCRIVGHVIESVLYAAIVAGIFGAMWPKA